MEIVRTLHIIVSALFFVTGSVFLLLGVKLRSYSEKISSGSIFVQVVFHEERESLFGWVPRSTYLQLTSVNKSSGPVMFKLDGKEERVIRTDDVLLLRKVTKITEVVRKGGV